MISPAQIKAARMLLGWKQVRLAEECGLSWHSISKVECGDSTEKTVQVVKWKLEDAGIEFMNNGLRLKG